LRAVNKASNILRDYPYTTGNLPEDARVTTLIRQFLQSPMVRQCSADNSFDESQMFSSPEKIDLKKEFKQHFRKISSILDCVTCEKCKVHGKLQILGLGTALKILFSNRPLTVADLQRNEVISLIVTLVKFSDAIRIIHELQRRILIRQVAVYMGLSFISLMVLCSIFMFVRLLRRKCKSKHKAH